nr:MAG TPA_asm: PBP-dependent ABC transporter [Caudoviricetes sp.]
MHKRNLLYMILFFILFSGCILFTNWGKVTE